MSEKKALIDSADLRFYRMDPSELKRSFLEKQLYLVDVREEQEILSGTIQGALFAPLSRIRQLQSLHINPVVALKLPSDAKPLLLFCASGQRVLEAASCLSSYYPSVFPLGWGYADLLQFGLPTKNISA